ncbi:helix-turn-helix domain-containing protein [Pseudomonas putida]|jgi:transcriptional regulator with XRE-family HTH domain|uniref:helix-turn-helix domain-containing protein n=1 Tax=Pseudomonas putida TaxID=303 RepID=UPI000A69E85A|nr:helix-turn-helix transcriptional regulator [Pseudomonas putida]MCE0975671.1 helix-turn-helix domain-containing protein [Pseudomonas putida]MDD2120843.1 helix-turn-helix domain-containing protein [Pseudomonas putida]UPU92288.1 helix-turn-helix domain-containing protein [Pseudomonas putida]HDS1731385.1 helix-turn-helix transcriptional regulator [Pseudomonas putida]
MELRQALAQALRKTRNSRGLTQEAFSDVSGRTYLSALERGLRSPTLDKIVELSERMDVHPLSLLTEVFLLADEESDIEALFAKVRSDLM